MHPHRKQYIEWNDLIRDDVLRTDGSTDGTSLDFSIIYPKLYRMSDLLRALTCHGFGPFHWSWEVCRDDILYHFGTGACGWVLDEIYELILDGGDVPPLPLVLKAIQESAP